MGLFEKKEIVFEMRGRKDDFKRVKAALREKGIKGVSSSVWQDELPVGGCGAKLDVRDFGPNGKIDRDTYTIRVSREDAEAASSIVLSVVPDYQPHVRKQR